MSLDFTEDKSTLVQVMAWCRQMCWRGRKIIHRCCAGIILWMRPANERWHYIAMLSLIGWAHTKWSPAVLFYIKFLIYTKLLFCAKLCVKQGWCVKVNIFVGISKFTVILHVYGQSMEKNTVGWSEYPQPSNNQTMCINKTSWFMFTAGGYDSNKQESSTRNITGCRFVKSFRGGTKLFRKWHKNLKSQKSSKNWKTQAHYLFLPAEWR